eukprot:CAMPEP_0114589374 /NCGR_PEP_ID=MMETSP0125-20121206/11833_1 /TAXON_ID=485358 ORGANISM="Aristerostoma sp., Strain ATCC 50986" /NCGR_SAMPLE_ID=MMETSP0125 /ASSEMBLY_ACC=CAM_ASM_000245 /LENGTH=107 /DNA_ID=CAMNT_0001786219 /DNA_START=507 /DNA_END=830 /DNA_ORIENTATION=+
MERGKICILEIDVQGAHKVQKNGADCHYLFIEAPSIEELRNRLVKRGTEKEEQIERRLKNAEGELQIAKETPLYEKFLVNDDLNKAFDEVCGMLKEFYPSIDFKDTK